MGMGGTLMPRYAAFLRALNVGGNHVVKMTDLAAYFREMSFENVKTLIASGNVLFDAAQDDIPAMTAHIESTLHEKLGYEVKTCLWSQADVRALAERNPFHPHVANDTLKLYVTFLCAMPPAPVALPITNTDEGYTILADEPRAVFTLSYALPNGRYADFGKVIDKAYRVPSTTRNWNTVCKMAHG
jgi:uncharacterized protein (DUF1697 family)